MSRNLERDTHSSLQEEISRLSDDIKRLRAGEAVIIGGEHDIKYLGERIKEFRDKYPCLGLVVARILGKKLKKIDPSLSTWEARRERFLSSARTEGNEGGWGPLEKEETREQILAALTRGSIWGEPETPESYPPSARAEGDESGWGFSSDELGALDREVVGQVFGIFEAHSKTPLEITREEAQKVVNERGLEDGIYVLRDKAGKEAYAVLRDGELLIFRPPDYDLEYLKRSVPYLEYGGKIMLEKDSE